jgi:hypothetical protein
MGDGMTTQQGYFLRSLHSDRKMPLVLTFAQAAELAKTDGTILFEYLEEDRRIVPFTDCDYYCDLAERPTDDFIDGVRCKMFSNLNKLVGDQCHPKCDLRMATRHGIDAKKGVYKLSFRCFIFGFVTTLSFMRSVIVRKGLDKNEMGMFDKAPYNKTQLLGCVGFCKSDVDKRVLVPCNYDVDKFLCSNSTVTRKSSNTPPQTWLKRSRNWTETNVSKRNRGAVQDMHRHGNLSSFLS